MLTEDERQVLAELGRKAAALRRRGEGRCVVCGQAFEGYLNKRYCSHRCAQRAYRQRHHEDVLRRKREAYRRRKGQAEGQQGQP